MAKASLHLPFLLVPCPTGERSRSLAHVFAHNPVSVGRHKPLCSQDPAKPGVGARAAQGEAHAVVRNLLVSWWQPIAHAPSLHCWRDGKHARCSRRSKFFTSMCIRIITPVTPRKLLAAAESCCCCLPLLSCPDEFLWQLCNRPFEQFRWRHQATRPERRSGKTFLAANPRVWSRRSVSQYSLALRWALHCYSRPWPETLGASADPKCSTGTSGH